MMREIKVFSTLLLLILIAFYLTHARKGKRVQIQFINSIKAQKWKFFNWISIIISVGECVLNKGFCEEARNCSYIWENTPDCIAFQKVCCYPDHDYYDPWAAEFLQLVLTEIKS